MLALPRRSRSSRVDGRAAWPGLGLAGARGENPRRAFHLALEYRGIPIAGRAPFGLGGGQLARLPGRFGDQGDEEKIFAAGDHRTAALDHLQNSSWLAKMRD